MAKLEQLKREYEGDWLAISIVKKGAGGIEEGDLVCHARDKEELWRTIRGDPRPIYVTYAGPLIDEGFAVAF